MMGPSFCLFAEFILALFESWYYVALRAAGTVSDGRMEMDRNTLTQRVAWSSCHMVEWRQGALSLLAEAHFVSPVSTFSA